MGEKNFFEKMLEDGWRARVEWFREFNKKAAPYGTVLVGDSLTQEFLIHEWMALDNDPRVYSVHNRGIGGDTTGGLLKRMNESIIDLKPSKVFLLIGTNDIALGVTDDEIVGNVAGIVGQIRNSRPDTPVHIISLYPVNAGMEAATVGERTNERIRILNSRLEKLAQETGANYLDMHSLLADERGNLRREYTREGLHLSPAGYEVVYRVIDPLL